MRRLSGGGASRRKRRDDVLLRLAYPDEGSAERDEVLRYGLEVALLRNASAAAREVLAKLAECRLPSVEAALDATVAEAVADQSSVLAHGPGCVLSSPLWLGVLPVEIIIGQGARKGESGKRRKGKLRCSQ